MLKKKMGNKKKYKKFQKYLCFTRCKVRKNFLINVAKMEK